MTQFGVPKFLTNIFTGQVHAPTAGEQVPLSSRKRMVNHVNIVITGQSGTGKSQLINALQRIPSGHYDAAATCPVGRGTTSFDRYVLAGQPVIYRPIHEFDMEARAQLAGCRVVAQREGVQAHYILGDLVNDSWRAFKLDTSEVCRLKAEHITAVMVEWSLWDLPGYGSYDFPNEEYVGRMGLLHFNMVLLVVGERVTPFDKEIVSTLKCHDVPCLVVQSKIDTCFPDSVDMDTIRCATMAELNIERVYLVSCHPQHLDDWDMERLRKDIFEPFTPAVTVPQ